mmetsp:Transcript_158071/g.383881  ORF Transcript_158071/g.383881 Transcript_158071/m.383881 type:complete len:226 (-) Transcript_158071:2451-3128(-)
MVRRANPKEGRLAHHFTCQTPGACNKASCTPTSCLLIDASSRRMVLTVHTSSWSRLSGACLPELCAARFADACSKIAAWFFSAASLASLRSPSKLAGSSAATGSCVVLLMTSTAKDSVSSARSRSLSATTPSAWELFASLAYTSPEAAGESACTEVQRRWQDSVSLAHRGSFQGIRFTRGSRAASLPSSTMHPRMAAPSPSSSSLSLPSPSSSSRVETKMPWKHF